MRMKRILIATLLLVAGFGLIFATGQSESSGAAAGPRYPDTVDPFGMYDETVVLTFAKATNAASNFPESDSYANNIWTREIAKALNIELDLKWEAVDEADNYDTKLNLSIASGDLTDVIYTTNASQFTRLVNAGRLEDLTEAFDKFAYPQLKEWYAEDGGVRRSWGTVGEKLYGITGESPPFQTARMIFVRKDWRENLGIDAPTTMNDIIDMAKAFKAVDPDNRYGILITKDILDNGMSDMFAIANSMASYPRRWIEDGAGDLVYGSIQEGMKNVLAVYRDLYEAGLVNPEFATTDGGNSAPQLTNSMVGIAPNAFWLYSWPLNSLYVAEGIEWECYPVLPWEGYEGQIKVSTDKTKRKMVAVRKGYEYPEALIKILNFEAYKLNDVEGSEQRFHSDDDYNYHMMMPFRPAFGPLRVNFDTHINVTKAIDNNDTAYLVSPHDVLQYDRIKAYFDAVKANETPDQSTWVAKNFFYGAESAFGVLDYYWKNDLFMISPAAGIKTEEMIRREESLNKLEEQYYVEIITGKKPIDAFDDFVSDWRALGGDTIEKEINEWFDSIQ